MAEHQVMSWLPKHHSHKRDFVSHANVRIISPLTDHDPLDAVQCRLPPSRSRRRQPEPSRKFP